MDALDTCYARLLEFGFLVLREAIRSGDSEWAAQEIEMLHNVPSLIGETNVERHRYYWFTERQHHIDWVSEPGRSQPRSRMLTYYQPIWQEMEPLLLELLDSAESKAGK